MGKSNGIRSMTVEIPYQYPDTLSDSFRVYLCKSSTGEWLKTILLVARGDANPINYFFDTYEGLMEFLTDEEIDPAEINVYLDMMELMGTNAEFLFHWDISNIKKPIRKQFEAVKLDTLSEVDLKVLENYYADKWSIFTESCLTNSQKVELLANALADSIYDEETVELLESTISHKLLEAVEKGSKINRLANIIK